MANPTYDPQRQAADMFAWMLLTSVPASILGRLGLEAYRTVGTKAKTGPTAGYKTPINMPKSKDEKVAMTKAANFVKDLHKKLSDAVYNTFVGGNKDSFLAGGSAKTRGNVPWLYGVGVPASLATAIGGWKGTDSLIKGIKKRESKSEQDAAKEEYNRLIQLAVQSARPKSGSALDALAELGTKSATYDSPWYTPSGGMERAGDLGGGGLALLTALFLLSAGVSGKFMWDKTKARNEADLVGEAQRIRSLAHQHGPGVPMYIPHTEEDEKYS